MVYIILVNYNGYEDTIACVNSLLKMQSENFKIVIVDNGSTDNSVEAISSLSDARIIFINAQKNLGFSGGNNLGIEYALQNGADYLLLLNNDTEVDQDFLNILVEVSNRNNNEKVLTGKIKYYDKKNTIWYAGGNISLNTSRTIHYGINEIDTGQYDKEKKINMVCGCCMFIPTELIKCIGLMSEDYFLYCEDVDYSLQFIKHGFELVYVPNAVIYHKVSASTSKLSNLICYYTVRNKNMIVKRHIPNHTRLISYLYIALETLKRLVTNEYSLNAVKEAYLDFFKGVIGEKMV